MGVLQRLLWRLHLFVSGPRMLFAKYATGSPMVLLDPFRSQECHLNEDIPHQSIYSSECRLGDISLRNFAYFQRRFSWRRHMPSIPSVLMFGNYEPLLRSGQSMSNAVATSDYRRWLCRNEVADLPLADRLDGFVSYGDFA
jgi:hypothetical protein